MTFADKSSTSSLLPVASASDVDSSKIAVRYYRMQIKLQVPIFAYMYYKSAKNAQ